MEMHLSIARIDDKRVRPPRPQRPPGGQRGFVLPQLVTWVALLLSLALMMGCVAPPRPAMDMTNAASATRELAYSDEAPGLDENPLRGFMPFAGDYPSFPHSLEWFYLPLRDIMTGPDDFDWRALDRQLDAIAARGHQAVFRIYVDYPKRPSGLPQFLLDAGLATYPYTDSGNTLSVSPDYRDPRLIAAFTRFIAALGARYDGDPRIAFITAGLYGFWGEWHVHRHPLPGEPAGWQIAQADKDRMLRAWLGAFHRTLIQIRYGDSTLDPALKPAFGYHDDSFAWQTLGPRAHDFWPTIAAAGLANIWRQRPIGGEVYPQLQSSLWDAWPNTVGQDVATAIATTHVSWLINSGVFKTPLSETQRRNALRADRQLGYRLYANQVTMRREGGRLQLTLTVENRGVAPFYYDWPVEIGWLDDHGRLLARQRTDWHLSQLQPGPDGMQHWRGEWALPPGARELALHVVNPLANGMPLRFANATQDARLPGWLSLGALP